MKTFVNLMITLFVLSTTALYAFLGIEMFNISMISEISAFYRACAVIACVVFSMSFLTCVVYILLWAALIAYFKDIVSAKKKLD